MPLYLTVQFIYTAAGQTGDVLLQGYKSTIYK